MTMDHQSFVGAGQYVLPSDVGGSQIVGCLTDPSRLDEQCVGGGQLIIGRGIAPTVTAKWAKGSGGLAEKRVPEPRVVGTLTATYGKQSFQDMGHSGPLMVWPWDQRERERERVVSALTSSIQNGADVRNAQAGHLIVERASGEVPE